MRAYPPKLRIGDRTYRVRFVGLIENDPDNLGVFDPNSIEIKIQRGLSPDETLKTFLHELFHAFEYEYEIKLRHKDVYALEEATFDFLSANSEHFYSK